MLEEKRTALISHVVTRGLDPDVELKDSGVEWLGQIPAHWETGKVGYLCHDVADGPHHSPDYVEEHEGIPFLSARNVKVNRWALEDVKYISPEDYHEFSTRIVPEEGDVLYTKGGTTGVARVVDLDFPFQVWVHIAVLKPKREQVSPRFLAYSLNGKGCYEQSQLFTRGATNNDLGLTRLVNIRLAVPPIEEQYTIADYLDRETAKIDALIAKVEEGIERLKEYRTALISTAVTGQIDVRREVEVEHEPVKEVDTWGRMNLGLELIRRMQDVGHTSFGRIMLVKMLYVIQHHVRVEGMKLNYRRMEYGPYDPRIRYGLEKDLRAQKWYEPVEQSQDEYGRIYYKPLEKAREGKIEQYFEESWGDVKTQIEEIVGHFQRFDATQAEIVATLYAAWNDLLLLGEPVNDDTIIREVLHNWHERKQEIPEDRWRAGLEWMREESLVPSGFGVPTIGADSKS